LTMLRKRVDLCQVRPTPVERRLPIAGNNYRDNMDDLNFDYDDELQMETIRYSLSSCGGRC
jgi:hypothetical protein